jgi:hypothetical protein
MEKALLNLHSTLNTIQSSGRVPAEKMGLLEGLLKSAELILNGVANLSSPVPSVPPPTKPKVAEHVEHRNLCVDTLEDFIFHAKNSVDVGDDLERQLIKHVGENSVVPIAIHAADGKLLIPKNAVIYAYYYDSETSRVCYQVDSETVIVCKLELVVTPVVVVHACT